MAGFRSPGEANGGRYHSVGQKGGKKLETVIELDGEALGKQSHCRLNKRSKLP